MVISHISLTTKTANKAARVWAKSCQVAWSVCHRAVERDYQSAYGHQTLFTEEKYFYYASARDRTAEALPG